MIGVYSAGKVVPFSLLVPVTGLPGASLFGKKQLGTLQIRD